MQLYVISKTNVPLVKGVYVRHLISKKELLDLYDSTSTDLLAFQSKQVAERVMATLLIAGKIQSIRYTQVPVIYTIPVSDENRNHLPNPILLSTNDLNICRKTAADKVQISRNFDQIKNDLIQVLKLPNKNLLQAPLSASYLSHNGEKLITTDISNKSVESLSLQVLSGFIAALGIVAVAVAFLTLHAASGGVFGAVMTGMGATAMLSGGIGFFRFAIKPKFEPFNRQFLAP